MAAASGGPSDARAQNVNPIVSAAVSTDTIRVGQVFTLELHVDLPSGADVRFPAVLPLPEDIEQREAVNVRSRDAGRGWSADYSLMAWSSDSLAIEPVLATVSPEGGADYEITIVPPPIVVSSVLPADEAGLELRDARTVPEGPGVPLVDLPADRRRRHRRLGSPAPSTDARDRVRTDGARRPRDP